MITNALKDSLNFVGKMGLGFIHSCGVMQLSLLLTEEIKVAKTVTSKERKKSGTKSLKAHVPFKSNELKDVELVIDTLLECIKTGDIETFREVLMVHLITVNKVKLAQKAGIGRRTLYDLVDPKKKFNPELSTISAIIQALAA